MPLAAHLVAELDILPVTQNMGSECLRTGFWMTISPSWHYPFPNSPPKGPARLPGDPDGWCPAPRVAAWNLGPHLSTCLLSAAPCLPPHPAQYGYSPATVLDKGADTTPKMDQRIVHVYHRGYSSASETILTLPTRMNAWWKRMLQKSTHFTTVFL